MMTDMTDTYMIVTIFIRIGNLRLCTVRKSITSEVVVDTNKRTVLHICVTVPPMRMETIQFEYFLIRE